MAQKTHTKLPSFLDGFDIGTGFALLVSGSPVLPSNELLSRCAACAGTVIAVDSGADPLAAAGLPIDVLVGDLDSISPQAIEYCRGLSCRTVEVPPEKDFTDIELALSEAKDTGAAQAIVLGWMGGKLAHELATLGALSRASQDMRIAALADDTIAVFLSSSGPQRSLAVDALGIGLGSPFSVIAFTKSIVSETDTYYPIDSFPIESFDGLGVSNYAIDPDAMVSVSKGDIAVIASDQRQI